MITLFITIYLSGFLASYIWLNFTNREHRTWGYVVLSFIYSLGSWACIIYSILEFWWTEIPSKETKWWLRTVPKWFPFIVLLISCSPQNYNRSIDVTVVKWEITGQLSANVISVTDKGDTLVLPYRWYAGRKPTMDTGWRMTVQWDSTAVCKKGYSKSKVKFIE